MSKIHVINDESLGGLLREYIEVDRKAEVGDKVTYVYNGVRDDVVVTVTSISRDGYVEFDEYRDKGGEEVDGFGPDAYRVLEPTDIVHIDELVDDGTGLRGIGRYRLVDRKAEVGEKVIIVNAENTYGKYRNGSVIYVEDVTVYGIYNDDVRADDDIVYGVIGHDEYRVLEPVADEVVEVTESDASPQVIDMLANLSRRIVSLEQQLRDTQRNVETLAQDIEVAKYGQDDLAHVEVDVDEVSQAHDVVNHPAHYNAGKYEVIDVITDVTEQLAKAGASGPECYAIGNVLKYVMRYRHKNGVTDLRKAAWYLGKVIEEIDGVK